MTWRPDQLAQGARALQNYAKQIANDTTLIEQREGYGLIATHLRSLAQQAEFLAHMFEQKHVDMNTAYGDEPMYPYGDPCGRCGARAKTNADGSTRTITHGRGCAFYAVGPAPISKEVTK